MVLSPVNLISSLIEVLVVEVLQEVRPFMVTNILTALYVHCVHARGACPGTHRGQSRASGHLELELQMVVNCFVGAGR